MSVQAPILMVLADKIQVFSTWTYSQTVLTVISTIVTAVEADSGGEAEAGTVQREVVRLGGVSISVSYSGSPKWHILLTGFKQQDKIGVEYFDTETLERKKAEMFMEGYN